MQSSIYADIMDSTRELVYFYIKNVPREKWDMNFEVVDRKFNSIAWTLAHMAWAQNSLVLKATGGPALQKEWFSDFEIGKPAATKLPPLEEIESTLKQVHELSLAHVRSLSDDDLATENSAGIKYRFGTTKKALLTHHIRHEGTHVGQLAWLAKMHGVKTI